MNTRVDVELLECHGERTMNQTTRANTVSWETMTNIAAYQPCALGVCPLFVEHDRGLCVRILDKVLHK